MNKINNPNQTKYVVFVYLTYLMFSLALQLMLGIGLSLAPSIITVLILFPFSLFCIMVPFISMFNRKLSGFISLTISGMFFIAEIVGILITIILKTNDGGWLASLIFNVPIIILFIVGLIEYRKFKSNELFKINLSLESKFNIGIFLTPPIIIFIVTFLFPLYGIMFNKL